MPAPPSQAPSLTNHSGSTPAEIAAEPEWGRGHQHRVGFLNSTGRRAGLTHDGDHAIQDEEERRFVEDAMRRHRELRAKSKAGELITFEDVMRGQTVRDPLTISCAGGTKWFL